MGWGNKTLGRLYGLNVASLRAVMNGHAGWVTPQMAEMVRGIYDDLSMRPGPSNSARTWALKRGWPPPLAWDDDTIDDPTAEPFQGSGEWNGVDPVAVERAIQGDRVHLTLTERAEAVRRLAVKGVGADETARRLHVSKRTVTRTRRQIAGCEAADSPVDERQGEVA